jgi:hypothetical protein
MPKPKSNRKKKYKTYATKEEALLALCEATCWHPGELDLICPTADGRFFYACELEDEEGLYRIGDRYEAEKIKVFLARNMNRSIDRLYYRELRRHFDEIVPPQHPLHRKLWAYHFGSEDALASCADGYGGYCDAKGVVKGTVGWVRDCQRLWAEEVTKLAKKAYRGDKQKQAIKKWTRKGKTPHELAGISLRKWKDLEIYTEDDFRDFIEGWVEGCEPVEDR